jgi:hypothetical protein
MNKAVFIFTCLLKLSTISAVDIAMLAFAFLGFICLAFAKHDLTPIFDVLRSPPILMAFAYRFAQDIAINQDSIREGEYFALLFTRPITRISYVFTKAVVIALGVQTLSFLMMLLLALAEFIAQSKPFVFIGFWEAVSLWANCFGIGCLVMLLMTLPLKWSYRLFFVVFGIYAFQSTLDFSVKLDIDLANNLEHIGVPALQAWQGLFSFVENFLYPVLNLDAIMTSTVFTWTPLINYVSDCLLYLTAATYILNKREFSYAYE